MGCRVHDLTPFRRAIGMSKSSTPEEGGVLLVLGIESKENSRMGT